MVKQIFIAIILLQTISFSRDTLIVDIPEFRPMVIKDSPGYYSGFSIDLWNNIAKESGYVFKYHYIDTFSKLFDRIENGISDLAISGISVTEEREKRVDFSYSYFHTGLGILILKPRFNLITYCWDKIQFFFNLILKLLPYFFWWALYVCSGAMIMYWSELGNPHFDDKLGKGFPEARFFVHVIITSTGLGNQIPKSPWGRRVTVVLMYSGIFFMVPVITGKITSEFNVAREQNRIAVYKEDLKNKTVAVKRGTTAIEPTRNLGAEIKYVANLYEAIEKLINGEVYAVVSDFVALKYREKHNDKLLVLDDIFAYQDYAIVLPYNSKLKENINRKILKFREAKTLQRLENQWIKNR